MADTPRSHLLSAMGLVLLAVLGISLPAEPARAIVAGTSSAPGEFPWIASVRNGQGDHLCGGVLIAPRVVLTAAHCVGAVQSVVVGGTDIRDRGDGETFEVTPGQVQKHEDYDPETVANDLAFIHLDRAANATPIALNDDPDFPQAHEWERLSDRVDGAVMAGWGRTRDQFSPGSTDLRSVEVPVVSNASCVRNARPGDRRYITSDKICAGQERPREGACHGDSGGPIVAYDDSRPYLIGISSFITGNPMRDDYGRDRCGELITVGSRISSYGGYIADQASSHGAYLTYKSDYATARFPNDVSALPLVSNHAKTEHVFSLNSASRLDHYSRLAGGRWNRERLGLRFFGSGVEHGPPTAIIGPGAGNNNVPAQHVFARRNDGHLLHYWWINYEGWNAEDLTTAGRPLMDVSGPVVINGPERGNRGVPEQHVFGVAHYDFNRLVHYRWINHSGWSAEVLPTATVNGAPFEPVGLPMPVIHRGTGGSELHVYVRSADDHLILVYPTPNGWNARDLTELMDPCNGGSPGGCPQWFEIKSDPVVVVGPGTGSDGSRTIHVFAEGSSNLMAHYWWVDGSTPSGWSAEFLPGQTGGLRGRPFVLNGPGRGNRDVPSQHVFLRNADGDLIHFYWVNYLGWGVQNLTAGTRGEPLAGDPVAVVGNEFGNDGVPDVHVLAPGSNARLLHYHWLNHQGWQFLGDATGGRYGVATSRASAIRGAVSAVSGENFSVFARRNIPLDPVQIEMRGCCAWRVGLTAP